MRLNRSALTRTGIVLSIAATGGLAAPLVQATTIEIGNPESGSPASIENSSTPIRAEAIVAQTPAPTPTFPQTPGQTRPTPSPAPTTPPASGQTRPAPTLTPAPGQTRPAPAPAPAIPSGQTRPAPLPTPAPGQTRPAPAPAPAPAPTPAPVAPAAAPAGTAEPQLYERAAFIGACRSSGPQPLSLSSDVTRNRFLGTIQPFTRITLTGVIAYNNTGGVQYVQISQPQLGYVPTATLLTDCNAGPSPTPTPTPTPDVRSYRVLPPNGLLARSTPNGTSQNDGPAGGSTVTDVNPPQQQNAGGRSWRLVRYVSINGSTRQGWVAETAANSQDRNLLPLP